MSAPVIEVWHGVLVVPVVGQLDAESAASMMDRLLASVVSRSAHHAILDLTAVEFIDAFTAQHLLGMIHALRLLETHGMISGVRPSVAQALVGLGVDLGHITTLASLHAALQRCMEDSEPRKQK